MSAPIRSHGVWRPPPPFLCGVSRPGAGGSTRSSPAARASHVKDEHAPPATGRASRANTRHRTRLLPKARNGNMLQVRARGRVLPARQPMSQGQCVAQRCSLLRVMEGGLAERSSACSHLAREIESDEAMLTPACLRESPEGAGRERGRLGPLTASRRVTPSASAAERGCSRVSQRRCGVRGLCDRGSR